MVRLVRQKADMDFVTGPSYPIQAPSSTLTPNGLRTGDWTWVAHVTRATSSRFPGEASQPVRGVPQWANGFWGLTVFPDRKPSVASLCQEQT
jgi:hypothetical protein